MKKITLWVDDTVDALSITAISTRKKGCNVNVNVMAFDITNTDEIHMPKTELGDD